MSPLARMMAECVLVRAALPENMKHRFDRISEAALRNTVVSLDDLPDPRWDRDGSPREVWDANVIELHGHSRRVVDEVLDLLEDVR